MKIEIGFNICENSSFYLVLKWKYCKLSKVTAHLFESKCSFCTKWGEQVHFCHRQKLPRVEKRQWEKGHQKGFWFSDRWGGFFFLLQRLPEPYRLRFGSFFTLSVVQAKHVIRIGLNSKATPAVPNKRSEQCYFLCVNGYFSSVSQRFPCFSVPFWHSFYWLPCFAPSAQWRSSKRSWDPFPVSFCKGMRAGNIYGYSYQRSCKPRLLTVWFWHLSLCWFWVMWNICDSIMQQLI